MIELGRGCKRCGRCCEHANAFIEKQEIRKIAKKLKITEEEFLKNYTEEKEFFNTKITKTKQKPTKKGSKGECIFYKKMKGCTIQSVKPFYCKISTCKEHGNDVQQWYYANYLVNPADPESLRQWNMFLKFNKPIVGASIKDICKDSTRLKKVLDYEILK